MRRLSLLCLLVPAAAAAGTPPTWRATNLTEVAGFRSSHIAMNDLGQVASIPENQLQAAIWSSSAGLRNLPNTPSPYGYGDPLMMNNRGEIIMGVTRDGEDWTLAYRDGIGFQDFPQMGQYSVGTKRWLNDDGDVLVQFDRTPSAVGIWNIRTNVLRPLPTGYGIGYLAGEYMAAFSYAEQRFGTLHQGVFSPLQIPAGNGNFVISSFASDGSTLAYRVNGSVTRELIFDNLGRAVHDRTLRSSDTWFGMSSNQVLFGQMAISGSQSLAHPLLWSSEWGYVNPLDHTIGATVTGDRLFVLQMNSRNQMIVQASSASGDFQAYYYLEPVPEPASFAVLGLGLLPFLRRHRR